MLAAIIAVIVGIYIVLVAIPFILGRISPNNFIAFGMGALIGGVLKAAQYATGMTPLASQWRQLTMMQGEIFSERIQKVCIVGAIAGVIALGGHSSRWHPRKAALVYLLLGLAFLFIITVGDFTGSSIIRAGLSFLYS